MTRKIQEAMKVTIPTRTIDPFRSSELPQPVLDDIKERNRLRRRYRRTREAETRVEISEANRRIQNSIRQHRNDVYRDRLTKVNVRDGSFWKLTKHLRKQFQPITSLEDENGSIAMEDGEIVAMAARTFEGYHQVPDTDQETVKQVEQVVHQFLLNHPPFPGSAERLLTGPKVVHQFLLNHPPFPGSAERLLTGPSTVKRYIMSSPSTKAPGHDNIQGIVLKNLPKKLLVQLTYIINGIFRLQHFPATWKRAVVTPVPKPGKKTQFVLQLPTNFSVANDVQGS
ncbi:hypothetical protein QE152_g7881 [Popillia japonica]|uniref:RNA-directed DNA polymerase from transposon X-element n=1 Tax=Popillia japonica TaxID=7064 RepID=A0AAW1MDC8_POPJA